MLPKFLKVSFVIPVLIFASCNDAEKTAESGTTADTSAASTPVETVAPASTIVTTPQAMMLVRQKVGDFQKWKAAYESVDSMRQANGLHKYILGRGLKDSNTVLVITKADDAAKAQAFAKSPGLKAAMQKAGVIGAPTIWVTNTVFQDTASIGDAIRTITTFKVKSWDTWQKVFPEGNQERIDNGLVVRAFGNSADDSNRVVLGTALTDTAKAFAYYKSDALKKRRDASGAIGEPERFLYRIVQRY